MTVYTLNGKEYEYKYARAIVHDGVLTVVYEPGHGYLAGETIASFPLSAVERWNP